VPHNHELSAVSVLVPFAAVVVVVMVWRLRRRGPLTARHLLVGLLICAYAAFVLDTVLLPYPIGRAPAEAGMPWYVWVNLVPLGSGDPVGLWLNLVLFVPIGALLPLLFAGISARRVLLTGVAVSMTIELVQLVGDLTVSNGRVCDVDDLLANSLGTAVGYVLFLLVTLVPPARRLVALVTWPTPAATTGGRVDQRSSRGSV
jgi:glycopeptide antibiotics resistance protein